MKKSLCILLSVIMILGCSAVAFAEIGDQTGYVNSWTPGEGSEPEPMLTILGNPTAEPNLDILIAPAPVIAAAPLSDIEEGKFYTEAANYCIEKGYIEGKEDYQFHPEDKVTRAEFVTLLYNIEGQPAFMNDNTFSDVKEGAWYEKAVVWAAGKGIVEGNNGKFNPNAQITREEMAAMIYNYAVFKEEGFVGAWVFLLPYEDRAEISGWADVGVHWCCMKQIVEGDNNYFKPKDTATRAEAVTIIKNLCEREVTKTSK